MIAAALVTLLVVLLGVRVSGAYDTRTSFRWLAGCLFAAASIVLLQVGLSLIGWLAPAPLIVATILFCAVLEGFARRFDWGDWKILPSAVSWGSGLLWGVIALQTFAVALFARWVPPYGWDTLVYHLTDVFHARATGSLAPFEFPGAQFYFPKVGELCGLWGALLAGGGEETWRVTSFMLVGFGPLLALATVVGATTLDLPRTTRWIAPLAALAPIVLVQPLTGYVDVVFAAFLAATFAFVVAALREGRRHAPWAALAAGLALGTKWSMGLYVVPIACLLTSREGGVLLASLLERRGRALLWVTVAFLAGGGFWIVRNSVIYSNPVYPFAVDVAGFSIFEGPVAPEGSSVPEGWFVSRSSEWILHPFREHFHGRPAFTVESGFGPLFAMGFGVWPFAAWIATQRREWRILRVLWMLPVLLLTWWLFTPYREPRYVIVGVPLAIWVLGYLVDRLSVPRWALGLVVTSTVFFGVGGVVSAAPDLARVVPEVAAGTWRPERFYDLHYGDAGRAFNALSSMPRGTVVTCTNPTFLAPLFGWHGQHRVVVAAQPEDPPVGSGPRVASYLEWRRFLERERVEQVVRWIPWWDDVPRTTLERWIDEHPEDFALRLEFGERVRIYEPLFVTSSAGVSN